MDLCQYKDSLGVSGQGFHEARIGDFALWDIIGTLVIMLIILIAMSFSTKGLVAAASVVPITIFLHWLFCVPTALNKKLGL